MNKNMLQGASTQNCGHITRILSQTNLYCYMLYVNVPLSEPNIDYQTFYIWPNIMV